MKMTEKNKIEFSNLSTKKVVMDMMMSFLSFLVEGGFK